MRKTCVRFLTMMVAVAAIATAWADDGVVEGRVALPPVPPARVVIKRYSVVTKGGVVATSPPLAVVYLDGPFPRPARPAVVRMAQQDLTFVPLLLPVQAGTRVEFPNLDDTYHDVFSFSPVKRFDLGRYRRDEHPVPSEIFEQPGLVTLRCDIHEHMRGLILVLETPYFVVTEPDGRFRLAGLPPGRHVLKAWLSSRTTLVQPVEIRAGTTVHVDFP